jgi:Protein of unknown function (DUF2845)
MRKAGFLSVLFALTLTLLWIDAYADSFSCQGGIISTDDRSADVVAKCGDPDFRDSHQEEVTQRLSADTKQKVLVTVEEWTYNLGPSQFMRIVVLKNGRVTEIRTGNYGYEKP